MCLETYVEIHLKSGRIHGFPFENWHHSRVVRVTRWFQISLSSHQFPFRIATITYLFSFGLNLVLGNTYFWDDWINRITKAEFAVKARLSGFPPTRDILEFDLLGNSPIAFRIITFLSYFAAAICLHRVLSRGLSLSFSQVNVICLLFLLAPVNSARAALIIMHYSLSFALFFCAWAILVAEREIVGLFSIPLFWISFGTPSLLPFFLLPILHWLLLNRNRLRDWSKLSVLALLTLTPVSYWIVRALTFGAQVRDYYVPRPLGVVRGGLFVLVGGALVTVGVLKRGWSLQSRNRLLLASLGLLAVALGASTYMAGGHLVDISDWLVSFVPGFSDWDSRHQLLLGLGIAVMLCAAIIDPKESAISRGRLHVLLGTLAVFCILNFTFSQEYYLDSLKQEQVISALKEVPRLKTVEAVMIDDRALRFNARGRAIRSFEWEEMINISFNRKKSIFVEPLRYVDCKVFQPTEIIQITARNGRLESILTRNLDIQVRLIPINPCK